MKAKILLAGFFAAIIAAAFSIADSIIEDRLVFKGKTFNAVSGAVLDPVDATAYVLLGVGGADGATNTIALADPKKGAAGARVVLSIHSSIGSNKVRIAAGGNVVNLKSDFVGDKGDMILLQALATNAWLYFTRTDNDQ